MKHILILLFLFSTHSFSGVIDGKGIDCDMIRLNEKKIREFKQMWWFNNSSVAIVGIVPVEPFNFFPLSKNLDIDKNYSYYTTSDTVKFDAGTYLFELDRKDLSIVAKDLESKTIIMRGNCKVLIGFEEVKKRQKDLIEKLKKENKKAREGNKI